MTPDRLANDLRRDDERARPARDRLHSAQVPGLFGRFEVLGRLDRQEIVQEEHAIDVGTIPRPAEEAVELERKLADVEIDPAPGQKIARRAPDRKAVPPDPGERVAVLPGPALRNPAPSSRPPSIAFTTARKCGSASGGSSSFQCLRMLSSASRAARGARTRGPNAVISIPDRRSTSGFDEMVGEREIDPVDPVGRPVQHPQHETGDVERDRPAQLGPHAGADDSRVGAPSRSTPLSWSADTSGWISSQSALPR